MKKQIASFFLVFAIVLIAGCSEQISADQIAAEMKAQNDNIKDFSATMVMTTSFSEETETRRMKVMTKKPDKMRSEIIEPAELAGTVLVRNGSTMWTYEPAKNQVKKKTLPFDEPLDDYTKYINRVIDECDLSYKGTDNLDGRSTYVIEATLKDEFKHEIVSKIHIWVDRENKMLLGIDMYDYNGNSVMKMQYMDVTFNTSISDSEFIFEVPEGVEVVKI